MVRLPLILLLLAGTAGGCHQQPKATVARCLPGAQIERDHSKCLSAAADGADTVVDMQTDGSCRLCSDLGRRTSSDARNAR